jgi:hypothetical protein
LFRENPDVSLFVVKDAYSAQEFLNLDTLGFKLAFTVVDYYTLEVLDDPTKVEWVVLLQTYKDLLLQEEVPLKTHKCDDSDWPDFYEFSPQDAEAVERLSQK